MTDLSEADHSATQLTPVSTLLRVSRTIFRSMSFTIICTYLEVKDVIFLQRLNTYSYGVAIPRAIHSSPVIFQQPCGYNASKKSFNIYNAELGSVSQKEIVNKGFIKQKKGHFQYFSTRCTQMPNGRIFIVAAGAVRL